MLEEITCYDPSLYIRAGQVRWSHDFSCIVYTIAKISRKLNSECWKCIVLYTTGKFVPASGKQSYPGLIDDKWISIDPNNFILDTNEQPMTKVY